MVCLGNICRSPLAHGILESKLNKEDFYIDSAGTAAYHIGNQPDQRSIAVAKSNNIDISSQSARQFKATDFDSFDIIYAMDQSNYNNIVALVKTKNDIHKVKFFLEENTSITNKNVPDPYYGNTRGFLSLYQLIDTTCNSIASKLTDL